MCLNVLNGWRFLPPSPPEKKKDLDVVSEKLKSYSLITVSKICRCLEFVFLVPINRGEKSAIEKYINGALCI